MVTVAQVTEEHPVHWIYETKETAGPALSPYNRQLAISHIFHIAENSHVSVWMQTCCKKTKKTLDTMTSGLCHTTPLERGYDTHGNSFISGLLHKKSYDMAGAHMTLLLTKQLDTADGRANKEIKILDIIWKSL